eukprot:269387-Pyramimonas_sp.AAC.1
MPSEVLEQVQGRVEGEPGAVRQEVGPRGRRSIALQEAAGLGLGGGTNVDGGKERHVRCDVLLDLHF